MIPANWSQKKKWEEAPTACFSNPLQVGVVVSKTHRTTFPPIPSLKLTVQVLKNDGWKILSFWGPAYFQGLFALSFRDGLSMEVEDGFPPQDI